MVETSSETAPFEKNLSREEALDIAKNAFRRLHNFMGMRLDEQGVFDESSHSWTFGVINRPSGRFANGVLTEADERFVASFEEDVGKVTVTGDRGVSTQPPLADIDDRLQQLKNGYSETLLLAAALRRWNA